METGTTASQSRSLTWWNSLHLLLVSEVPAGSSLWVSASGCTGGGRRERVWATTQVSTINKIFIQQWTSCCISTGNQMLAWFILRQLQLLSNPPTMFWEYSKATKLSRQTGLAAGHWSLSLSTSPPTHWTLHPSKWPLVSTASNWTTRFTRFHYRDENGNELTAVLCIFIFCLSDKKRLGKHIPDNMFAYFFMNTRSVGLLSEAAALFIFHCTLYMYTSTCLCFVCATASAPLSWLLSWLLLFTLGITGVSYPCLTFQLSTIPSVQKPLKHRLPLQAFNAQLLCLLVLQFSPSPSPLQVLFICPVSSRPPKRCFISCPLLLNKLGLSDIRSWLFNMKSFKTKKLGIINDLVHAVHTTPLPNLQPFSMLFCVCVCLVLLTLREVSSFFSINF